MATVNSTIWVLADSLSWWRLLVATFVSVALVVAWLVLDPDLMGSYLHASLGYGDLFVLTWLVASAATVGGGLGSGLESDDAIRAATYSKREEERRGQIARARR